MLGKSAYFVKYFSFWLGLSIWSGFERPLVCFESDHWLITDSRLVLADLLHGLFNDRAKPEL